MQKDPQKARNIKHVYLKDFSQVKYHLCFNISKEVTPWRHKSLFFRLFSKTLFFRIVFLSKGLKLIEKQEGRHLAF